MVIGYVLFHEVPVPLVIIGALVVSGQRHLHRVARAQC